jgi:DNA-binding XRE family transcriptional regulator
MICKKCKEKMDRNFKFCPLCGNERSDKEQTGEISERIKFLREELGVTQEDVSKALGYTRQAIVHYEQGKTVPNADKIKSLCKYFKVTSDYLIGLSNVR